MDDKPEQLRQLLLHRVSAMVRAGMGRSARSARSIVWSSVIDWPTMF